MRARRNHRTSEHLGSDDEDDANGNYGGKDSSSADERSPEVKPRRQKRWTGSRYSQSSTAANSDAGYDENDSEVNRELLGASAGLVGSSEILAWGKGGLRSNTRHGGGSNGKFARNSQLSKLMEEEVVVEEEREGPRWSRRRSEGRSKVVVEPHRHEGVFIAKGKEDALVTKNIVPSEAVYNEKRISVQVHPRLFFSNLLFIIL